MSFNWCWAWDNMLIIENKASEDRIIASLEYSSAELAVIDKIKHCVFMGMPIPIPKEDLKKFTTLEGIKQQLSEFRQQQGFLYYVTFNGDKQPDMARVCVTVKHMTYDKVS